MFKHFLTVSALGLSILLASGCDQQQIQAAKDLSADVIEKAGKTVNEKAEELGVKDAVQNAVDHVKDKATEQIDIQKKKLEEKISELPEATQKAVDRVVDNTEQVFHEAKNQAKRTASEIRESVSKEIDRHQDLMPDPTDCGS